MTVHLHTRSAYSLLDSTMSVAQIVKRARSLGYRSIALTDENCMHGAMEFYHLCQKEGMHPIFGLECAFVWHQQKVNCVLIAQNEEGYHNCIKASSILMCSNEKVLTFEQFLLLKKNCFVILFAEGGIFENALNLNDESQILVMIDELKHDLSDFRIGLSYQDFPYWKVRNQMIKRCAQQLHIRTVALSKVYYAEKSDESLYRVVRGIRLQKTLNDTTLTTHLGRYMRSPSEMEELYDPDDLMETEKIASQCHVNITSLKASLPVYPCPQNLSSKDYLTSLCVAGLKKRFALKRVPQEYVKRLRYELDVILSMKFEDYFLIVWDFIRFARKQGIYVGPGRGSAAGSLVAYSLGITHIDPIQHDLLFERFLNPERVSMPDIDTDFPDDRRDEVIDYVISKYGQDHVAHICTFGTLGAKQVLRDVGRVMDIPVREIDILTKAVPNALKMTLERAMKESSRFSAIVHSEPKFMKLYEVACRLEGLPRHVSTHAAGVVLSSLPLSEIIPTMSLEEGVVSTQYTMEYMEELGLIKMDFLGLRNLTIIDEIVQQLKKHRPDFDIMKIPLDDARTFDCIKNVDTMGVFQLESDGMKSLVKKMQPSCFDDIVATIALFRPGPMDNIPLYLENKNHPEKIQMLHPVLQPILKSTYGVMIYQEQIMSAAQVMAGFSLGKADILRKAMSKKKMAELEGLKNDFIQGCLQNGYDYQLSHDVYELILKFANYGFNKAHSVAYGLIAYQMAYLKANAPLEFFTSLLNSVIGSENKTAQYIDECRRRHVTILGPSINHSSSRYLMEQDAIRFPLSAINGIGSVGVREILEARYQNGRFEDFYDCIAKLSTRKVNRKMIEALIDSGAMDEFRMNRKSMKASLEEALNYANLVKVELGDQVHINLNLVSKPVPTSLSENMLEKAEAERNVLGFYLSSHPILMVKNAKQIRCENLAILAQKMGLINGFAVISRVRQHKTKKGEVMAFVTLTDESASLDMAVMPRQFARYQDLLVKNNYLLFEAKKDRPDSCILQSCRKIEM
ncbi:MAG: DNA polymerase III subunit alpha [Erysipelotrichaceae bacterium]|nr:DNA polymerase III subunit alpha [Erysipelotrichaceae bacterium]